MTKCPDLLYGIYTIDSEAQTLRYNDQGKLVSDDVTLTLIPYYAWNHRGPGNMAVLLSRFACNLFWRRVNQLAVTLFYIIKAYKI